MRYRYRDKIRIPSAKKAKKIAESADFVAHTTLRKLKTETESESESQSEVELVDWDSL